MRDRRQEEDGGREDASGRGVRGGIYSTEDARGMTTKRARNCFPVAYELCRLNGYGLFASGPMAARRVGRPECTLRFRRNQCPHPGSIPPSQRALLELVALVPLDVLRWPAIPPRYLIVGRPLVHAHTTPLCSSPTFSRRALSARLPSIATSCHEHHPETSRPGPA